MSRIRVNIDSLVLKGLDPDARQALVQGLRTELTRVLSDPAARTTWTRSRRTPVLKLGRVPLQGVSTSLARAIAKKETK